MFCSQNVGGVLNVALSLRGGGGVHVFDTFPNKNLYDLRAVALSKKNITRVWGLLS